MVIMLAQHKASDLSPEDRTVVERLLGRELKDNEVVEVNARGARADAWRAVLDDMHEMHTRVAHVPEDELYALIDEAVEYVRHHPE
jgi:hypothetical protein